MRVVEDDDKVLRTRLRISRCRRSISFDVEDFKIALWKTDSERSCWRSLSESRHMWSHTWSVTVTASLFFDSIASERTSKRIVSYVSINTHVYRNSLLTNFIVSSSSSSLTEQNKQSRSASLRGRGRCDIDRYWRTWGLCFDSSVLV